MFTPGRSTRKSIKVDRTAPIKQLLTSLIHVEIVSLKGTQLENRKVQFSGFDCSSTKPTITSVVDSHVHHEESIQALAQAMTCMEELTEQKDLRVQECIESLIHFLRAKISSVCSPVAKECARSISPNFLPLRIVKSAKFYISELDSLLMRMRGFSESRLQTQARLAEFVGQAIKYWLRMFFDSAPPRSSPADKAYFERIHRFSTVDKMIKLVLPPRVYSTAVEDKVVSAIFSNALNHIQQFLKMSNNDGFIYMNSINEITIPKYFTRPGSLRTLDPPSRHDSLQRKPLSSKEAIDIMEDISDAYYFLIAYKACMFLIDLLQIKGVRMEVERQGGWSQVETLATISWQHELWKICDPHFVLLSNYTTFIRKLEILSTKMNENVPVCQQRMRFMEKTFRIKPRIQKSLGELEDVKEIVQCIDWGQEIENAIPNAMPVN